MGILFVVCGGVAIAVGILGKDFHAADVITGLGYRRKTSRWSGRLVFIVVGVFFVAMGVKFLLDAG